MKKIFACIFILLISTSFKQKQVEWVAIGDSITYLNDHPAETGNRVSKGYLSRVTDELTNIRYINQGHNGWTASGIADSIENLGLVKADVYSVFLGTNDWWSGGAIGAIEDYKKNSGSGTLFGSFRIIINKLRILNPDAKLLLITPMQRGDFVYVLDHNNNAYGSYKEKNGQSLESFVNAIKDIGKYEHIAVIDLYHEPKLDVKHAVVFKRLKNPQNGEYQNYSYPEFTKIPFDPKTDEYPYPPEAINMTYDGLHPSDKGNAIIAEKVIRAFKKMDLGPR